MKLFICATETSADLYAGHVVRALKERTTNLELRGVGGKSLAQCGMEQLLPQEAFQVMGFTDVIKKLPSLCKNLYTIQNAILRLNPDVVLFIDAPGLSMRLAPRLRKKGYTGKIVQLVAPTVWAYKKERADTMACSFDLLLTLFDFEPPYFAHTPLKTVFVGHPILECIEEARKRPEVLSFTKPVLALFPGSRPDEIKRNLPKQMEAAQLVLQRTPEFEIVVSGLDVPFEARYELMRKSRAAIAKCGTVTLELALHGVTTVVTYELTWLNRLMAKHLLKLEKMPYFSIANIVAGKALLPECIKPPVEPEQIAQALLNALEHPCDMSILSQKLQTDRPASVCIAEQICGLFS